MAMAYSGSYLGCTEARFVAFAMGIDGLLHCLPRVFLIVRGLDGESVLPHAVAQA
jgi:hypothetical protein